MDGTLELLIGLAIGILACCTVYIHLSANSRIAELSTLATLLSQDLESAVGRIAVLEKRKAVIADAVASQAKPAGVGNRKPRTWNEDAVEAE